MPYAQATGVSWRDDSHPLHALIKALKHQGGVPTEKDMANIPGGSKIFPVLCAYARKADKARAGGNNAAAWAVLDSALSELGEATAREPWPDPKELPAEASAEEVGQRMFRPQFADKTMNAIGERMFRR